MEIIIGLIFAFLILALIAYGAYFLMLGLAYGYWGFSIGMAPVVWLIFIIGACIGFFVALKNAFKALKMVYGKKK